ncbi:MAG: hypothetical protein ACE5NP_00340 [Anaerolineae bacterium]
MTQSTVNPEIRYEAKEGAVAGIFALTSAESKRLMAKGVAALPVVRQAFEKGRIIIANGTTTAFVAEELMDISVPKYPYAAGYIGDGRLSSTPKTIRMTPYVLVDGKPVDVPAKKMIRQFEAGDVFIKSGNAIDSNGHVGILMGDELGGTIGMALGPVTARGAHLIMPVGLEKKIDSVIEASRHCGISRLKYSIGMLVGLMPVVTGTVVTEIEALHILTGVKAFHVASGGIGGCEGAVTLVVEGEDEQVQRAFTLVESIKGEPPVMVEAGK